jgi:tRNA nucleotidyltransferase/poly(A) polymerase
MQWKIKNQGPLLAGISDSRLTEEIAKIIKSGSSGRIIEALEKMNLYEYLQPAASRLFKSDAVFKRRYLERFKALSAAAQEIPLSGALQALYRDYVEALIDWEKSAADSYNSVYTKVRQFILPMNPPHADLERSLKTLFRDHGISVTKSYYANRPFRRRHRAAGPAPSP